MDLRLLRYFAAVCEAGSLHGAADIVHVAQPSLSRQIRALEQQLGFALFHRAPRGLVLTPAGRAFLPVAEDLLVRADQATSAARTIAQGTVSGLTVVAASTTVTDIVAPFVAEADPDGVIGNALEATPEQVYGHLSRGEADFAIGTLAPPKELRWTVLGRAYIWAMMPPDHPRAAQPSIDMTELVREPLLVMDRAHRARQSFDVAVSNAGLSYTMAVEVSAPALAQGLAAAGRGIAVLSDDPRFGLSTVPISTGSGDLAITLYGVWDGSHYASDSIERCLEALSTFNQQVYPAINPITEPHLRGLAPA
ncbi:MULTISPECIES: LysR family transcriptional regulator [unclassified Leucobacter]|uniref:LysR family transcriptional regulator n=1 Tax=unclassified Leucobacter TaxID=2621730 RepID=UPI00165E3564|nr:MULTISPECIES: LysR family transcriptional regulator [unclassified Leucobacter]MBC9936713.1 LysR family transcriptional regulator [Leucobacter sp. cx-87]